MYNFHEIFAASEIKYFPTIYHMINSKPKKYVRIHNISKTVSKKFPDDLLLLSGFYSVHSIDTLLSHEATGEDV